MGHSVPRPFVGKDGAQKVHKRLELLPEETLYLVERGSLFCWKESGLDLSLIPGLDDIPGYPMTVQQAYSELIGTEGLTLERFQVNDTPPIAQICTHWVVRSTHILNVWVILSPELFRQICFIHQQPRIQPNQRQSSLSVFSNGFSLYFPFGHQAFVTCCYQDLTGGDLSTSADGFTTTKFMVRNRISGPYISLVPL